LPTIFRLDHTQEVIEIPDAALGASPDAPTLEGPVTVKIPAGTQSGAAPRLRGKELPEFGLGKYGDISLRLHFRAVRWGTFCSDRQLSACHSS
jgi:DnaJ-class molecular chaperone